MCAAQVGCSELSPSLRHMGSGPENGSANMPAGQRAALAVTLKPRAEGHLRHLPASSLLSPSDLAACPLEVPSSALFSLPNVLIA